MLKTSTIIILLMILCPGVAQAGQSSEAPGLELSMKVLRQRHCVSDDPEVFIIALDLQLKYKSVGQENIILPKGGLITYWRTGTDIYNLLAQDYGHLGWVTSGDGIMRNVGAKPDSRFVVLKAGESYETKDSFSIMGLGKLKPGAHLLQVIIEMWSGSEEQAKSLRERWRKVGLLWYGRVKSEPMPFTVEENVKLVKCSPDA